MGVPIAKHLSMFHPLKTQNYSVFLRLHTTTLYLLVRTPTTILPIEPTSSREKEFLYLPLFGRLWTHLSNTCSSWASVLNLWA